MSTVDSDALIMHETHCSSYLPKDVGLGTVIGIRLSWL